jgi:hypothetical protein
MPKLPNSAQLCVASDRAKPAAESYFASSIQPFDSLRMLAKDRANGGGVRFPHADRDLCLLQGAKEESPRLPNLRDSIVVRDAQTDRGGRRPCFTVKIASRARRCRWLAPTILERFQFRDSLFANWLEVATLANPNRASGNRTGDIRSSNAAKGHRTQGTHLFPRARIRA